jgi:hypothetical protein
MSTNYPHKDKKWVNELNRYLSNEEIQMAHICLKKMVNIHIHKGNANQKYIETPSHKS